MKKNKKKLPIFVKISPDETLNSLELLLNTLVTNKVSGVIISNTTIHRFSELPIKFSKETGGLSGKPLFEHSNLCLKNASNILNNDTIEELYKSKIYCYKGKSKISDIVFFVKK